METTTRVTDILRAEHDVILDVLKALEAMNGRITRAGDDGELDVRSAREAVDFLREFADRCHHGKEEAILFQALAERGLPLDVGPLCVMTTEHDEGRALVAQMRVAVDDAENAKPGAAKRFATAAGELVTLLRDHIAKENGVLFPMGDGMLTESGQAALLDAFERFEHADMGAGTHERWLATAQALCERFGVAPAGIEGAPRAAPAAHGCCGHGKRCA